MSTIANQPVWLLYTGATPHGRKAVIMLEELKRYYGTHTYVYQLLNLTEGEQRQAWFKEINPFGQIPVLVDNYKNGTRVAESAALLLYLAQTYDKDYVLSFNSETHPDESREVLQWLFWASGGFDPTMVFIWHFDQHPEHNDVLEQFEARAGIYFHILEDRLKARDYLVGAGRGRFSIADIMSFSWATWYKSAGYSFDAYPNTRAWIERIDARESAQLALQPPHM